MPHIYIGGNVTGNVMVGDGIQVIQNSFNKICAAEIQPELKETLRQLTEAVSVLGRTLLAEQFSELSEDLTRLIDEAVKPKPNKKWYSVSIEGLIKAAENLDKLGEPVLHLSKKVLSLLTGGLRTFDWLKMTKY